MEDNIMPKTSTKTKAKSDTKSQTPVAHHEPAPVSKNLPETPTLPTLVITATRPGGYLDFHPSYTHAFLSLWLCTPEEAYRTRPIEIPRGTSVKMETGVSITTEPDYVLDIKLLTSHQGFALVNYAADGSWLEVQNVNGRLVFNHGQRLALFHLQKRIPFRVLPLLEDGNSKKE